MRLERYRQIAAELASEIAAGTYPEGGLLPTREELAKHFKVSRATLNRAMDSLTSSGMIDARRGAGSVVVNPGRHFRIAYVAPEWLMRHMPSASGRTVTYMAYDEVFTSRSNLRKLNGFDGVLFSHPGEAHIPDIIKCSHHLPVTVINRGLPDCDFVSTDHRACFAELTAERLARLPDATPYFLASSDGCPLVDHQRREGFIMACREARRFYELIDMPPNFDDRLAALELRLEPCPETPLLIFSDRWNHTGALVRWVWNHQLKWQQDVFYADVDNTCIPDVWGITTTSILQDFHLLTQTALKRLLQRLSEGRTQSQEGIFIKPSIRHGDT